MAARLMIAVETYEDVLACYRSGQMSDRDLLDLMAADDLFSVWVLEHLRGAE